MHLTFAGWAPAETWAFGDGNLLAIDMEPVVMLPIMVLFAILPIMVLFVMFVAPVWFVFCCTTFVELALEPAIARPGTSPGAQRWLPQILAQGDDAVHGVPPPGPAAPTCRADAMPYPNAEPASISDNITGISFMALGCINGQIKVKVLLVPQA